MPKDWYLKYGSNNPPKDPYCELRYNTYIYEDPWYWASGYWLDGADCPVPPSPDIRANNSDEPITIGTSDSLSVSIGLDAGDYSDESCDWYIVVNTPSGWQSFNASQMDYSTSGLTALLQDYGLISFGSAEIFSTSSLSVGTYTYYFAIDLSGQLYYDSVVVNVQ